MSIKVEAIEDGFYGGRMRRKGQQFVLTDVVVKNKDGKIDNKNTKIETEKQFSKRWMKRVSNFSVDSEPKKDPDPSKDGSGEQ